jgi:hypothetical protein
MPRPPYILPVDDDDDDDDDDDEKLQGEGVTKSILFTLPFRPAKKA